MGKKKSENKWIQVGNYLLALEKNSFGAVLCVKNLAGNWSIRWGEDSYLFAVLTSQIQDEKCHAYVDALLTVFYTATNYPHDLVAIIEKNDTPFINGFCKLIQEQTNFEVSIKKNATQEEDDAALKEVVQMQEIQDELEKLDKEDGDN